jgi:GNAT superfamily N-acetyltransferase
MTTFDRRRTWETGAMDDDSTEQIPDRGPRRRQISPLGFWSRHLEIDIPIEIFERLPRDVDYRFEYYAEAAQISPRPRTSDAYLPLPDPASRADDPAPPDLEIRPLADEDWQELPEIFAAAFALIAPFATLDEGSRLQAARDCLEYTREGGDGPLVPMACQVAIDPSDGGILGGALVTLPQAHQLLDFDERRKVLSPPPPESTATTGWPHLTWIFVSPLLRGEGIGTALLAEVGRALWGLGYRELASSFQHGNSSSLRWHWRNGFQLLPYFGSKRWMTRPRRPPSS